MLLAVAREAGPELPQEHQNSGSPRHWLIIGSFLVEGRDRTESTVTGDRSHHWHPASRDDQPEPVVLILVSQLGTEARTPVGPSRAKEDEQESVFVHCSFSQR